MTIVYVLYGLDTHASLSISHGGPYSSGVSGGKTHQKYMHYFSSATPEGAVNFPEG